MVEVFCLFYMCLCKELDKVLLVVLCLLLSGIVDKDF